MGLKQQQVFLLPPFAIIHRIIIFVFEFKLFRWYRIVTGEDELASIGLMYPEKSLFMYSNHA